MRYDDDENDPVDLLIRPQLPCPADQEAIKALHKINGLRVYSGSLGCSVTGSGTVSDSKWRLEYNCNARTVPLLDATALPLTAYLVAIGLLPKDARERRELKSQLWNRWPTSFEVDAALTHSSDPPNLALFPADLKSVYDTILDYLKDVEASHDPAKPWSWDWDLLKKKLPAKEVLGRRAVEYAMWYLPCREDEDEHDRHYLFFGTAEGRFFYESTKEDAKERLVPAAWTVRQFRSGEQAEEGHVVQGLPTRWLFADPFITLVRSVQDISMRERLCNFKPEGVQVFTQLKALARLMESPYPSAYRQEDMIEQLKNAGFNVDSLKTTTPINKAPRVFTFPTQPIAHYNKGEFYIPPLLDVPYGMRSITNWPVDCWTNPSAATMQLFLNEHETYGVDEKGEDRGAGSDMFTFVPECRGVERARNQKLVVDFHTDELWEKIKNEAYRDGQDSEAVSKRLAKLLEQAGDFIEDGAKQALQLREEGVAYKWDLSDACYSFGEHDLPELQQLIDEIGPLI